MSALKRSVTAGAVKAFSYLAVGLGILWSLYLLVSFVLMLANADNLERYRSANIYQFSRSAPETLPPSVTAVDQRTRFRLDKVYGEYRYLSMPRSMIVFIFLGQFFLMFCFFVIFIQLANLFENLTDGQFFVAENALFLRRIGLAMIGYGLVRVVWKAMTILLFRGAANIPGLKLPWLAYLWLEIRLEIIVAGLAVLVFAELFHRAALLREDQELTI